jgi:hypothetical protein
MRLNVSIVVLGLLAGNFAGATGYFSSPFPQIHPERRYQSAHFILTAPAAQDAGRLLNELERARRSVLEAGLRLPSTIEARMYLNSTEFVRGSGGTSSHLAVASGGKIHLQPLDLLLKRNDLAQALRHELAHIAMSQGGIGGIPRWFHEGLAMVVAGELRNGRKAFRKVAALEDSLAGSRSYSTLRAAYSASRYLVDRLVARHGHSRVTGLVQGNRVGETFDERFRSLVGEDWKVWCDRQLKR